MLSHAPPKNGISLLDPRPKNSKNKKLGIKNALQNRYMQAGQHVLCRTNTVSKYVAQNRMDKPCNFWQKIENHEAFDLHGGENRWFWHFGGNGGQQLIKRES